MQMWQVVRTLCVATVLGASAVAGLSCRNGGSPYYQGPNNRLICACKPGWAGLLCDRPAVDGVNTRCNPKNPVQCADGTECMQDDNGQYLCLCSVDSFNPACNPRNVDCNALGCPSGLQCNSDRHVCECEAFSSNPVCQCNGFFQPDENDPSLTIDCTLGADGFCVNSLDATQECSRIFPPSGPSVSLTQNDLCDPGLQPNSLGQCVCKPLSSNPKCVKKPSPTPSSTPPPRPTSKPTNPPAPQPQSPPSPPPSNSPASSTAGVCAKFNTGCKKKFGVDITLYTRTKGTGKASTKVSPAANYFYVNKGIVPGAQYVVCVKPKPTAGWKFNKSACAGSPAAFTCCQTTVASTGASKGKGCALFTKAFKGPAGC